MEYSRFIFQSDPSTAFLRAARAGQLEKVLEYLESGVDINASNAVSRDLICHSLFLSIVEAMENSYKNFSVPTSSNTNSQGWFQRN